MINAFQITLQMKKYRECLNLVLFVFWVVPISAQLPTNWTQSASTTANVVSGDIKVTSNSTGSVYRNNIGVNTSTNYRVTVTVSADPGISNLTLAANQTGVLGQKVITSPVSTSQNVILEITSEATLSNMMVEISAEFGTSGTQYLYIHDFKVEELQEQVFAANCEPYSTGGYRYGFQGQERDDEVKGNGNTYNYKFRMHDPRLGRFFAVDPLTHKFPHYTPYQFSGNKLVHAIELEGAEELVMFTNMFLNQFMWNLGARNDRNDPEAGFYFLDSDGQERYAVRKLTPFEKQQFWDNSVNRQISQTNSGINQSTTIIDGFGNRDIIYESTMIRSDAGAPRLFNTVAIPAVANFGANIVYNSFSGNTGGNNTETFKTTTPNGVTNGTFTLNSNANLTVVFSDQDGNVIGTIVSGGGGGVNIVRMPIPGIGPGVESINIQVIDPAGGTNVQFVGEIEWMGPMDMTEAVSSGTTDSSTGDSQVTNSGINIGGLPSSSSTNPINDQVEILGQP